MSTDSSPLRLATRGSRQALGQANVVAEAVAVSSGRPVELVLIETSGDARQDVPLHSIGGQGVFVKEVQRAVLDGRADLAVHSAKDLMSEPAAGLTIGAYTERRSPHDVLVGSTLEGLATGATVASGSVRRRAQLASVRPDLRFVELRGNIDTRLSKIPDDGAIVMARAALEILDMTDRIDETLPIDRFVPAVGQGCVAVECRSGDATTLAALSTVDHAPTRHRVEVERAFLAELGSGCSLPVAGHVDGDELRVFLAEPEQNRSVSEVVALSANGANHDADLAAARSVAHRLQEQLG